MDEYTCDIHLYDETSNAWPLKESRVVNADSVANAKRATENWCYNNYSNYRVQNVRLTKKFVNIDGEI